MSETKKNIESSIDNEETIETKTKVCSSNNNTPFYIIILLLLIIAILAFFAGKNYSGNKNIGNNNLNTQVTTDIKDVEVTFILDKRCSEDVCHNNEVTTQIKNIPFLSGATFNQVDFSEQKAKDLIKENDIVNLPAVLLNKTNLTSVTYAKDVDSFNKYLKPTKAGKYFLDIGINYDPNGEICDNKIDDNGDNLIDCLDPKCSKEISCAKKVDKPVADLYIMSYCPYGLQAQKGYLEVMSKLGKVADVNIKFVQYVMHGQKEADENVVQYCIQKEQKDKYVNYLNCYLKEEGKNEACRKQVKIDEKKLTSCIDSTKKEFSVDEKMADKSKQYPDFDIYKKEALEAGVQGSPTFVLNGIKMDKIGRDAKGYAEAICSTFNKKPKECEEAFQNVTFDPMFGFTSNGANANSGCAQ